MEYFNQEPKQNITMMKPLLFISLIILSTHCEKDYSQKFPYQPPQDIQDGLQVGHLQQVQMDENMISHAVGRISNGKYGEIHSMLLYKDNMLVFEDYFEGHQYQWDAPGHYGEYISWDRETAHCIQSDTKSITSLCIGIAIDKGYIESVHQSIFDYLPDHQYLRTPQKEKITIEHVLTMTSGLEWREWGVSLASIENDQIGIWFWEDGPMDYTLSRELVAEPGTRFNYSGGDIQILVEILRNATGMTLEEFSGTYLFEPLGIDSYDWWLIFPSGEIQGAGGLKLTPRDMVKIGAMMLNHGLWDDKRIVSEKWISKSKTPYAENNGIKVPGEDLGRLGYGYTWWTKSFACEGRDMGMYLALGWGGQKIMVLPDLDMIVVFTGANYNSNVHQFEIVESFILEAIN
jgi:CubicO group peptidase (beta-lactamase class C family)